MNLTLHVHKPPVSGTEYQAITAFLDWQMKSATQVVDGAVLAETRGVPKVVVKNDGKTIAVGLLDLIDYWRNNGLFLL